MRSYLANLSVRSKVLLLILTIVCVLLTAVLAIVWGESVWEAEKNSKAELRASAKAFEKIEKYRVLNRGHIAAMIGSKRSEWLRRGDEKELCAAVKTILSHESEDPTDSARADYVAFQAEDGRPLAVGMRGQRGQQACEVQLNQLALKVNPAVPDRPLVMTYWESPDHRVYTIYTARITDVAHRVLGTVSIGYLLNSAAAEEATTRADTDFVIWYYPPTGTLQPEVLGFSGDLSGVDNLPARLKGSEGKFGSGRDKYDFIKATPAEDLTKILEVKNDARVVTALVKSHSEMMKPVRRLALKLGALALCSLLIGIGLGVIFSRPIVRPLIGLANVARDVKKGKYDGIQQLRLEHRRVFESADEIGTLCRAFEDMVVSFSQSREMSKYISHSAYNSLEHCGSCHTERKWMCVLFSDIRNFSGFSDGRDPESVVQRLNQVLGIQAETVAKHGGDIDKFIGDAMVAWFTGDDRCRRAVNAAREMLDELATCVGDCAGGRVGVGIHIGEVIVGGVGSPNRLDYTAIGSTVNLASRLCSAAKPGQILISQAVLTELGNSVPLHPLEPIHAKGFAEPVQVYEVVRDVSASAAAACEDAANAKAS